MRLREAEKLRAQGNLAQEDPALRRASVDGLSPNSLSRDSADALHWQAMQLVEKGEVSKGLELMRRALELAPDSAVLHHSLGKALLFSHRYEAAIPPLSRAAELTSEGPKHRQVASGKRLAQALIGHAQSQVAAERSRLVQQALDLLDQLEEDGELPHDQQLDRIREMGRKRLLPSWHFSMLFDEGRNRGYLQAIERHVKPGDLVLEIGTGSGLLAMMAARAGAEQVITCEVVEPLARVASQVVAHNGYADRVTVVPVHSSELQIGKHLPRRADVLVSEILDMDLIGEGVNDTIADARQRLLTDRATLIPQGASIWVQLVELQNPEWVQRRLNDRSGFDLRLFEQFHRKPSSVTIDPRIEPHRLLSDRHLVRRFDYRGDLGPSTEQSTLTTTDSGIVDGVLVGFDVELDDEITLTSGPGGQANHWNNRVWLYPEPAHHEPGSAFAVSVKVRAGEQVHGGVVARLEVSLGGGSSVR